MDKIAVHNFIQWLDTASLDEIETRRQGFLKLEARVGTRAGKDDIQLGLKLIDKELFARFEVENLPSAKK